MKDEKDWRCPAEIEKGFCFASNSDPSCYECKKHYYEEKDKKEQEKTK